MSTAKKTGPDAVRDAEVAARAPMKVAEAGDPNMTTMETVFIPVDRVNKDRSDVTVGLNGKMYKVKRGEQVKVPRAVAEILRNSERQDSKAIQFMADLPKNSG